jgi:signal transduction histidine kinase
VRLHANRPLKAKGSHGDNNGAMSHSGTSEELAATLRSTASCAAKLTHGGCALLFAAHVGDEASGSTPQLRSAVGFSSPDAARSAATALLPRVQESISNEDALQPGCLPELADRGAGDTLILPLIWDGRIHGALAVGSPSLLEEETLQELAKLASSTALHLDHAHLSGELEALRAKFSETEALANEKNDELLKLSEELFAQDIELMRNNEKLGKIEKLKNDFIEKMSLELRTPLNSIIEATITVLAGENEVLSDHAKTALRTALEEGTAFQRTLQNILDLWRIKQGELPVELQEVNFDEVVGEAIFSVQETLGDKQISVEKQIDESMPKFTTDLPKVNQILFLLLDNAAKFTSQGEIKIAAHIEDNTLACSISDTGIGICPDDQQFIFDEFYQVDDLASDTYRGAGLGLTLVRDLLILLDGESNLVSEPGNGTTFTFRIPLQPGLSRS